MGSYTFTTSESGKTAEEAFNAARDTAAYEHGHGGYTGTIAEKDSFVMVHDAPMPYNEAMFLASQLIERSDERIDDKWGPAGCIPLDSGDFLFFGWASS